MFSHPQHGMEREEVQRLRREGGRWLRSLRERLGMSQRDLAHAVGADYYSFISQLEAGKGRVPIAQVEAWARALKVSRHDFAKGMLRFYDPVTYDMLFGSEAKDAPAPGRGRPTLAAVEGVLPAPLPEPAALPEAQESKEAGKGKDEKAQEELLARLNRLEALLMLKGMGS